MRVKTFKTNVYLLSCQILMANREYYDFMMSLRNVVLYSVLQISLYITLNFQDGG